jgi:hypothetical protein
MGGGIIRTGSDQVDICGVFRNVDQVVGVAIAIKIIRVNIRAYTRWCCFKDKKSRSATAERPSILFNLIKDILS